MKYYWITIGWFILFTFEKWGYWNFLIMTPWLLVGHFLEYILKNKYSKG